MATSTAVAFPVGKNARDALQAMVCRCGRGTLFFCWRSVIENERDGSSNEIHGDETQNPQRQRHKSHASQVTDYCLFWASSSSCCSPQPCWPHCVSSSSLFFPSPPSLHHPSSPHHQLAYHHLRAHPSRVLQAQYYWKVCQTSLADSCTDHFFQCLFLLQNCSPRSLSLSPPFRRSFILGFTATPSQATISIINSWRFKIEQHYFIFTNQVRTQACCNVLRS